MNINIHKFTKKYNQFYEYFYRGGYHPKYYAAIEFFDRFIQDENNKQFMQEFNSFTNDFVSSDREAAAFIIALAEMTAEIKILENKLKENHCQYCGEPTDSSDSNVLCRDCREVFGHTFFSEL